MLVETFPLGPLQTNCYVASQHGLAVAVDPGGPPSPVLSHLSAHGLSLTHILITHLHCDHLYGVAALSRATGALVLAGEPDLPLLDTELGAGGFMGLPRVEPFEHQAIGEGELELLGARAVALNAPGHSPGSMVYHFPEAQLAFVGDVIFERGVGRTDFPGGSFETLKKSIEDKIFTMDGQTVLYPGHGGPTTVEAERLHNPFLRDFL